MFTMRAMCGDTSAGAAALCSSWILHNISNGDKQLEWSWMISGW